jgi:hypothetical protein
MKTIQVELKGVTPLLMNNPAMMLVDGDKVKVTKSTTVPNAKAEAEVKTYRMKNGNLYVPSTAVKGCMINAASYKKAGKFTLKPLIAGGVMILPDEIDLGTKDYEIDSRTVVIRATKGRILCHRPKVPNWTLKFKLQYNEQLIADASIIRMGLDEAGQRIGLLDFRPQKNGSFGMFEVVSWKTF